MPASIELPLQERPIALIGFMGVGKSAVGRQLARRLGYEFTDTDELVEQRAGKTIARVFAEDGEGWFRTCETAVLRDALSHRPRVVATGGGITKTPGNVDLLLRQAAVVLLTADPSAIVLRVHPLEQRPLLAGYAEPLKRIRDLLQERAPIYANYHFLVDTTSLKPEEAAEHIAEWYLSQTPR